MKKTTKEMIEVMEAFEQGEEVEFFNGDAWYTATVPTWDWENLDYRVKEYKYPMWFESTDNAIVVRFDDLTKGGVIASNNLDDYNVGDYEDTWTPHTNTEVWTQIDEPKAKEKVTIEKWLLKDSSGLVFVVETSNIDTWLNGFLKTKKVRILESYTVEI